MDDYFPATTEADRALVDLTGRHCHGTWGTAVANPLITEPNPTDEEPEVRSKKYTTILEQSLLTQDLDGKSVPKMGRDEEPWRTIVMAQPSSQSRQGTRHPTKTPAFESKNADAIVVGDLI